MRFDSNIDETLASHRPMISDPDSDPADADGEQLPDGAAADSEGTASESQADDASPESQA